MIQYLPNLRIQLPMSAMETLRQPEGDRGVAASGTLWAMIPSRGPYLPVAESEHS